MNTLFLDLSDWDLCADASGNIAMATDPYSLAQDAASAIRMWLGEYWFDTTQGVPYLNIFGQFPVPLAYLKSQLISAALTVPEVTSAAIFLNTLGTSRQLTGQVQVKSDNVVVSVSEFSL